MITIGIDFDNTIITYDEIFYDLALEKKLITDKVKKRKSDIREEIIKKFGEDAFTLLQSDVYGKEILKAKIAKNAFETIKYFQDKGCKVLIISHKTKYPYKGPKYNLRDMALKWMKEKRFFDANGLNMRKIQVIFNETKEEKIKTIKSQGCDIFIDDLKSIVECVKDSVDAILFTNGKDLQKSTEYKICQNWLDIQIYLKKKYNLT